MSEVIETVEQELGEALAPELKAVGAKLHATFSAELDALRAELPAKVDEINQKVNQVQGALIERGENLLSKIRAHFGLTDADVAAASAPATQAPAATDTTPAAQ